MGYLRQSETQLYIFLMLFDGNNSSWKAKNWPDHGCCWEMPLCDPGKVKLFGCERWVSLQSGMLCARTVLPPMVTQGVKFQPSTEGTCEGDQWFKSHLSQAVYRVWSWLWLRELGCPASSGGTIHSYRDLISPCHPESCRMGRQQMRHSITGCVIERMGREL